MSFTVRNNPSIRAERAASRLGELSARVTAAENRVVTGLAIEKPSDAPGAWGAISGYRRVVSDTATWKQNAGSARSLLLVADHALGASTATLRQAYEKAVQFSNGTYSAEERASAADAIDGLAAELETLANTEVGGRYVFGGDAWDGPPFAIGAYQGGTGEPTTDVGEGWRVQTGFDGSKVFGSGADPFATLQAMSTALRANDPAAVAALLPDVESALQSVIDARQEVGGLEVQVDDAEALATSLGDVGATGLSELVEADPVEAMTALAGARSNYEAALQTVATSVRGSLFDKM